MRMSDEEQAERYNMSLQEYLELLEWNSNKLMKELIHELSVEGELKC